MDRKKFKRIFVTIALIGAFLMVGTGIKEAHADTNIDNAALYCAYAGYYQGAGEYFTSYALYYGDASVLDEAYSYQDGAQTFAYQAYYYAVRSSVYYAYDAYTLAYVAYENLLQAASDAYNAWYYDSVNYSYRSLLYGGIGAYYIAHASYYAGVLY
jgi:hypothetical protein